MNKTELRILVYVYAATLLLAVVGIAWVVVVLPIIGFFSN